MPRGTVPRSSPTLASFQKRVLITVPQGLTPDLCGLASHTRHQSAARALHCSADGQVLPLSRHIPLPVSPTVLGRRRPWALSALGPRRSADVALCATYLRCHEMTRSSYGAIISHSRLNNLLYLAVIQHTDSHTHTATDTLWHYATLC